MTTVNSILFKQAHTLTKQTIQSGDCYRIVFGQCYKLVKAQYSNIGLSLHTNYFKPRNPAKQSLYDVINDDNIERVVSKYSDLIQVTVIFITTMLIGLIYFGSIGIS